MNAVSPDAVALRKRMQREAAEQFARALVGTPGGADQRARREVAGDNAGEVGAWVAAYALDAWLEAGRITRREHEAADELARLYRASGGQGAFGGRSGDEDQEAQAHARAAYRAALDSAPVAARGPLQAMLVDLARGTAGVGPHPSWLVRPGLQAVADHLRLARD